MDMSQFGLVTAGETPLGTDLDAWGAQKTRSLQPIKTNRLHVFHFVTIHTHAQQPLLASTLAKDLMLSQFRLIKDRYKLEIAGYVVLDDHCHFLCATGYEMEIGRVVEKLRKGFTREWRHMQSGGQSGFAYPMPVWKPDFLSYRLTMVDDLHPHLNFIHYDAVRHGYVARAADYIWSSLPARVEQGHYPEDWATHATPAGVAKVARALYLSS